MDDKKDDRPRVPTAREMTEVLGYVPMLETYYRRGPAVEMPPELREAFREHGLTARHGGVLAHLAAGEPLAVSPLAQRMGVSLSRASELVGELDRAGLVVRSPDAADRRRTLVTLAPAHRAAVETFVARRSVPLLRVLDALSPRDRDGFARGLAAWAREIGTW